MSYIRKAVTAIIATMLLVVAPIAAHAAPQMYSAQAGVTSLIPFTIAAISLVALSAAFAAWRHIER